MKHSPAVRAELVALVARNSNRARLAITGTSMEPLLRAGMVVDIEPLRDSPRIADILIFRTPEGLIAHRLIGGEAFAFRAHSGLVGHPARKHPAKYLTTGGDAYPERIERVPPHLVIGRVTAVWSSAGPDARRIDDRRFYRRGASIARLRALRSLRAKGSAYARMIFGDPATTAPPPAFAALVAATHQFERREFAAGVASLESVPLQWVLETARRHHCGGLVSTWLDQATKAGITVPSELRDAFRKIRWTNALQSARVLTCVRDVRDVFAAADIPHIFLKGGARIAAGEPGADAHFSGDVDVLVPAERADAALAALRAAGYSDLKTARERAGYAAAVHHHREPLRCPHVDLPVEVHVALAPPAMISARLDYAALERFSRTLSGPAGAVRVLDPVASAVHLAYHARDLGVWRDIVLLSRLLVTFDAAALERFAACVRAEQRDGLRVAAAAAAARAITTPTAAPEAAVRRYLAWAKFREDLPQRFNHFEILEATLGLCPMHVLRLDVSRRGPAAWLRCCLRNLVLLPSIARIAHWRRAQR